ncbi:MAG: hypothetical protein IJL83_01850 [Clostridia bacterium]|nr:hypothetical protein [Clostridia bacterium]
MKRVIVVSFALILLLTSCSMAGNQNEISISASLPDEQSDTYEKRYENGVTERSFILQSGEYALSAVYTFSKNDRSPAVLLVPGSGPSDVNETIGSLEPFRDMAIALAAKGVNSLRIEKRTHRYADRFTQQSGLKEEYYDDYTCAYNWLKSQQKTLEVYLLGHSLGGQISVELSKTCGVKGLILWNSSLRHLAEIAADQYISADKANEAAYRQYESEAKSATKDSAKGLYYYGASDYYWVSYNELDILKTLKNAEFSCLVINSKADAQSFPKDIQLWQSTLGDQNNMSFRVFEDQSHFGYKIDVADPSAIYQHSELPNELISAIVDFICNGTS